ncbi:MAG: hypothetical protein GXY83_17395 [Rhodopirellula sp.]|nr:hypothetical protein [Rhodopirellula sp.]
MGDTQLQTRVRDLPGVQLGEGASTREAIANIFSVIRASTSGVVSSAEFGKVRDAFRGWGFDNVLDGSEEDLAAAIAQRIESAGGQKINYAPNGSSGDYVVEQTAGVGLADRVQFLLVDYPDNRRYCAPSFAVALKCAETNHWFACGLGLGVKNERIFDLVWVLRSPDDRLKSDALGQITGLSPEDKALIAEEVVRVLDTGTLSTRWDSYEAGPYGVAIARAAPHSLESLLDFATRHAADTERRIWAQRVMGEVYRRNSAIEISEDVLARLAAFLSAGLNTANPHAQTSWTAAESLGLLGHHASTALPKLKEIVSGGHASDPRVLEIYRTAIQAICV